MVDLKNLFCYTNAMSKVRVSIVMHMILTRLVKQTQHSASYVSVFLILLALISRSSLNIKEANLNETSNRKKATTV